MDIRFPLEAGMHLLHGIRVLRLCTEDVLQNLSQKEVTENDWYVITYPKSGMIDVTYNHNLGKRMIRNGILNYTTQYQATPQISPTR